MDEPWRKKEGQALFQEISGGLPNSKAPKSASPETMDLYGSGALGPSGGSGIDIDALLQSNPQVINIDQAYPSMGQGYYQDPLSTTQGPLLLPQDPEGWSNRSGSNPPVPPEPSPVETLQLELDGKKGLDDGGIAADTPAKSSKSGAE